MPCLGFAADASHDITFFFNISNWPREISLADASNPGEAARDCKGTIASVNSLGPFFKTPWRSSVSPQKIAMSHISFL
jgi:hypothetical protein